MDGKNHLEVKIVSDKDRLIAESPVERSAYANEKLLNSCIAAGDIEQFEKQVARMYEGDQEMLVGRMSKDELRQIKYTAVAFISIITRVSIDAGISENEAFSRSDNFIQCIDQMKSGTDVYDEMFKEARIIIYRIHDIKQNVDYDINIRKIKKYVDNHICDHISLADISKECKLSTTYISKLFKEQTGTTFSSYLSTKKIELAKILLETTDYEYCDISSHIGYCSQSYFIKNFKVVTGMTPKEYRNQYHSA